jgi:hypothetical protein
MANFKLLGRNGKMAARIFNFQKYKPLPVLQEQAPVQIVMGGIGGGGFGGGGLGGGYGGAAQCICPNGYTHNQNGIRGNGCYDSNGNYITCGSGGTED